MSSPPSLAQSIRSTIRRGPIAWAHACKIDLRPYQRQIARAIKDSIVHHRGLTFVVILPRQSGKNELQAHLFSWLLFRYSGVGGCIVSVSPTFKPQTLNNMDRVGRSLNACVGSRDLWKSAKGYEYSLGKACIQFFSGDPSAKVVGATADLLLSVDEAQEVPIAKFDKDFDPMTASTNATRVFWGTAWTSDTLLERQRRLASQAQQQDGLQRVFYFTADDVRRLVPAYGLHVDRAIAEHGRNHPRIRSQYFCETIDAQSGMFNPARLLLIEAQPLEALPAPRAGQLPAATAPTEDEGLSPLSKCVLAFGEGSGVGSVSDSPPIFGLENGGSRRGADTAADEGLSPLRAGQPPAAPAPTGDTPLSKCVLAFGEGPGVGFAFLIDVAGMDESMLDPLHSTGLGNPGRDSTTLSVVEIDLSTLAMLRHPTYHVVARHSWVGENHLAVFAKLKNLAETWHPKHIVIDATGVGEGLWALLDRAFPNRVIPVKFTQQEKSELGWQFLSIIETGRFRDHCHTDPVHLQYARCIYEVLPGPAKTLRWGVPDGARGPEGNLVHDDFVLADALVARLDALEWHFSSPTMIFESRFNPLSRIEGKF